MNTIIIFSGQTDPNVTQYPVYKGTFEISPDYILRRDLTQLKTSFVRAYDPDKIIDPYDIIVFYYDEKPRWGKVFSVNRDKEFINIDFVYGADVHQIDIPVYANQSWQNSILNNRQHIKTWLYENPNAELPITMTALNSDDSLTSDVALRQFMRRQPHYEVYTGGASTVGGFTVRISNYERGLFEVDPYPLPTIPTVQFRLDDPFIESSYILKIGQDKMTRLRLYNNESGGSDWRDYQLLNDGSIVQDMVYATPPNWWEEYSFTPYNANSVRPQKFVVKEAGPDQFAELAFAKEVFSQNEYDNEIEFTVSVDNPIFRLDAPEDFTLYPNNTCDYMLGQLVRVYLPKSDTYIETVVSGYEVQGGKMRVILGLTRTRLTDVINNYLNKDNQ